MDFITPNSPRIPYGDLPPLIPEPVEHIHITPTVFITPVPSQILSKATRPNQLDLDGPVRPVRHLKVHNANNETPDRRNVSPIMNSECINLVLGFQSATW